ncbi:MAG: threonine synthase [Firmicutes bacterium]|nr:threonine synthase [Bacillota bacterium]
MLYQSTRGGWRPVSAAEAIKQGLAPDGGLYVPEEQVVFSPAEWERLLGMEYPELAFTVLKRLLTDFTSEEVRQCVSRAYNPDTFDSPAVTPLVHLKGNEYILELWHGPTAAFKDLALQILPHLLTTSLVKTGEKDEIVILVATSGDTGTAALDGFHDVAGTRIVVFYPEQGVSEVQKRQMITQVGGNVAVISVQGNFDDAQSGVKAIFGNQPFNQSLAERNKKLSSANSINWGRLAPQIVYYISAYSQLLKQRGTRFGEPVNVVVPTGNFGNILAAYYAQRMGLPLRRLICAANANNVLTDFIRTGVYDRNREFFKTISPSMDILISSNLERLLFEVTGRDHRQIRSWMGALVEKGVYQVDGETREKIRAGFWSDSADDKQTRDTIRDTYRECGYLLDTHTAVGRFVYQRYLEATGDDIPTVIASTASPFKFCSSVTEALFPEEPAGQDEFHLLRLLAERCGLSIPRGLQGLENREILHQAGTTPDGMRAAVGKVLGL